LEGNDFIWSGIHSDSFICRCEAETNLSAPDSQRVPHAIEAASLLSALHRMVDRFEVIKGYEYEPGKYVLIDGEEIKKNHAPSGKTMEIITFLEQGDVDPIYFESSFFALPEAHRRKNPISC